MGARAISLAIFGILVIGDPVPARAECRPTAVPAGDPALVEHLVLRLTASGIATTPTAACPAMQVHLERRGRQVHLSVTDVYQRLGERTVRDVATAAAIIESWSIQAIEHGSVPPLETTEIAIAEIATEVAPGIRTSRAARSGLAASATSALGTNSTTWIGGAVTGCLRVGPTCSGLLLRGTLDTRASGATSMVAQRSRSIDVLAISDLPRRLGRFTASPGILVGYGRLSTTIDHHDLAGTPFEVTQLDHQLRGGLHVSLLRSIGAHLAVVADLAADAALTRSASSAGPGASIRFALGVRLEDS